MIKKVLAATLALLTMAAASSAVLPVQDNICITADAFIPDSEYKTSPDYMGERENPILSYRVKSDNTAAVRIDTGFYGPFVENGCFKIPSVIDGYTVTEIDASEVEPTGVKEIVVPDTVKIINDWAFTCVNCDIYTIPDSVTRIGDDILFNEVDIKNVTFKCSEGSYARKYAEKKGITCVDISQPTVNTKDFWRSETKYSTKAEIYFLMEKTKGTSGYHVYFYNKDKAKWERVTDFTTYNDASGKNYKYTKTGLKPGQDYKFMIKSYLKKDGKTYWSTPIKKYVATKPTAVKITKTSKTSTAVRLNWTKNDNATGYDIREYTTNAYGITGWSRVARIEDPSVTTVRLSGYKPGSTHKYRVFAYKTPKYVDTFNSQSAFSKPAEVTVTTKK